MSFVSCWDENLPPSLSALIAPIRAPLDFESMWPLIFKCNGLYASELNKFKLIRGARIITLREKGWEYNMVNQEVKSIARQWASHDDKATKRRCASLG